MEKYDFLNYTEYEKLYFEQLYDACRQGGQVEGKKAVDFLKLSNISPVCFYWNIIHLQAILREVWNLSAVKKMQFLSKEEFYIAMKYVSLAQQGKVIHSLTLTSGYGITFESLKNNFSKVDGPRLTGIPMPPQKQQSLNPFDELINEENGDDFDDFQEAEGQNEQTSTSSKVFSSVSQHNPNTQAAFPIQQILPQQQSIQQQPQWPNLATNLVQQNPSIDSGLNKGSFMPDLLDLNMGPSSMSLPQSQPLQQTQFQPTLIPQQIESLIEQQVEEQPKNFEDQLFNKLKNAKFHPQQQVQQKQDKQQEENTWASFQAPTSSEPVDSKNRYDLISDAFAELLETPKPQEQIKVQNLPNQQQQQQTLQDEKEDSFEEFEQAQPIQSTQNQLPVSMAEPANLLNFNDSPEKPQIKADAKPYISNELLNLYTSSNNVELNPKQELITITNEDNGDEEEFDDFQDAAAGEDLGGTVGGGPVSSIPEITDSRQDSNIFSNSKQDIENIENSFNSQEIGDKGAKNDHNWLGAFGNNQQDDQPVLQEESDGDFGEFNDADNANQNQLELQSDSQSSVHQNNPNILELDDIPTTTQQTQQEMPIAPPRPRVELNENNLLSGFMKEFGLGIVSQAQAKVETNSKTQSNTQALLLDLDFQQDQPITHQHKFKTSEFTYENKQNLKEEILQKIEDFFSKSSQSKASQDFSQCNSKEIEQILQNKEKLNELKQYLLSQVELSENDLDKSIGQQIRILEKIDKKNKKKNEAAANEEFELASKYKKQILQLQSNQLQSDDIKKLFDQKPVLTLRQLLELPLQFDQNLHFTKNLINDLKAGVTKEEIANKIIILIKQQDKKLEKIKSENDEVISQINKELKTADIILQQINELKEQDDLVTLEQLIEQTRFQRYLKGLLVLTRMLELIIDNINVSQMVEDDELSIDLEALLQDAQNCQLTLSNKIDELKTINPQIRRTLDQNKKIGLNEFDNINAVLGHLKTEEGRSKYIQENICNLCCHSFNQKGIEENITFNNNKYHPFCINFWLNKASTKTI